MTRLVAAAIVSAALTAGTMLVAPAAHAQSAEATNYALAVWPSEKAVPGDVFAIAQDLDGYLWLGTPGGLVRFDGSRFEPWTQQSGASTLPAAPVAALTSTPRGDIWVGFSGGGGVARIHEGRVTRYLAADGAPPGVNALLEDRSGTLWAATGHGLFRFANDRWTKATADDGYDGEQAFSVYEDREGRVWIGAVRGLYRSDRGALQLVDAATTHVQSMTEDATGALWVTDRATIVRKVGAAGSPRIDDRIRLPLPGWRLKRDRRGGLLVASFSGGLFRIADPASPSPSLEPVAYEHRLRGSPRALFEDRDDNIWVGMRGGLLRLSANSFQSAGALEGVNHDGVRTLSVGGDGSIWIATTHALNRFTSGARTSYAASEVRALHSDPSGTMWVASEDLVRRFVNGLLVVEPIPGVAGSRVNALANAPDGLWLCTAYRGVLSWSRGTLTSHKQPGESGRQCLALIADRRHRVWAGFTSGGVALHEGGRVRALTEQDGLAPGAVLQIIESRDGAIWFVTSGGISRYERERFTSITRANAPLPALVPVLVEDEQGYIWVGIHSGTALMRFHPREMDAIAEQRDHHLAYTVYDESDGLQPGTQMWQNGVGGVRDMGGRLWVINGPGVTIIDPRKLRDSRPASPPRLDRVTVNGEAVAPSPGRAVANRASLQIEYGALSLSGTSKLRFRHSLDGVDAGWIYDGDEHRAAYANLSAGSYRFRVSTTQDGQWTEPAVWAFTVNPPFYLTRWFLVSAGLVLIAGVVATARLRERAVRTRYALVMAERARMSREIHDTLLQNLAALGAELEALATRVAPERRDVATELRRIRRQVGRSVRDARDSVLELRRHAMHTPRLADSLVELAEDTASRHGLRPNVTIVGQRPENASPAVDAQLFRIAQEAVTNAVRHARPRSIDVTVAYEGDEAALTVTDDGCGFTAGEETAWGRDGEHFGLVTMRERAERVGGVLRVDSAQHRGTTVHAVAKVSSEWA